MRELRINLEDKLCDELRGRLTSNTVIELFCKIHNELGTKTRPFIGGIKNLIHEFLYRGK